MNFKNALMPFLKIKKKISFSIGTFDGVHKGHQRIIQKVKKAPLSLLFVFTHPPSCFLKNEKKPLILDYHTRIKLLKDYGIDYIIPLTFDEKFSQINYLDFLKTVLNFINPHSLVLGEKSFYGTIPKKDLLKFGKNHHLPINILPLLTNNQSVISSSLIRKTIEKKEFNLAEILINRPFNKEKTCQQSFHAVSSAFRM